MEYANHFDVAILGAGCAGLFLAKNLLDRGLSCVILDAASPGAFASTRNQGWLHSGALYATRDDIQTAQLCKQSYELITNHYPDAVHRQIPAYFLSRSRHLIEEAMEKCKSLNIHASPVSTKQLQKSEPLLLESPLPYALQVQDRPINTTFLLQQLINQIYFQGGHFQSVKPLTQLTPEWSGNLWRIPVNSSENISCRAVALTCGVAIPEVLARFVSSDEERFVRTKIPVLALHGPLAHSILITLREPQGPNLVPFRGNGVEGVTICLEHMDETIASCNDKLLAKQDIESYLATIEDFYGPGLRSLLHNGQIIRARFHVCQKLHLKEEFTQYRGYRSAISLQYPLPKEHEGRLFAFYPGKFTVSPVIATEWAEAIVQSLQGTRVTRQLIGGRGNVPHITPQPFHEPPSSRLVMADKLLMLNLGD